MFSFLSSYLTFQTNVDLSSNSYILNVSYFQYLFSYPSEFSDCIKAVLFFSVDKIIWIWIHLLRNVWFILTSLFIIFDWTLFQISVCDIIDISSETSLRSLRCLGLFLRRHLISHYGNNYLKNTFVLVWSGTSSVPNLTTLLVNQILHFSSNRFKNRLSPVLYWIACHLTISGISCIL